ncbi:Aste57867_2777 [Aphanomyces stellatus]|uniref:Aste57867_2777 protein n=1 Tax=Aphanomyces stellatus TaxID=120398 RepID=A0A485KDY7_9STRA|nr:hypothetical protein As57867_002770 [Aphanomyces stellatus]VFT79967.1 Aste57867_2777 [Aphanomyces stellatus]
MVRLIAAAALASIALARDLSVYDDGHFNVLDHVQDYESAREDAPVVIEEQWFESQLLDHTDAANKATWKQRYFFSDQFYGGAGSPVFLYVNGENVAANTTVVSTGLFLNELAKKHKALVVSLEHRYYGKSQPRPDFTTANLKYLRAEQALADIATFQDYFVAARNLTKASKWVAFGGSYPGMLAAWVKAVYPTRFAGSVASSAPIQAKVDFFEYADVVSEGLRYFGKDACVDTVRSALEELHRLLSSPSAADAATLKALFNPCGAFKNDDDRFVLERSVYSKFQNIAQSNDNAKFKLADVCLAFAELGLTPVQKLSKLFNKTVANGVCADNDYTGYFDDLKNATEISTKSISRQWSYQTCAEFGFGQASSRAKGVFGALKYVTVERNTLNKCAEAYGITTVAENVAATNQKYGGWSIDVANVVFPTGTIDPWAALAPSNATGVVNPTSEVVDIEGTSHCRDMYSRKPTDSGHLVWAHQRIEAAVDGFLRNKC